MPIWTEDQVNQYIADAPSSINNDLPCLFHRFYVAVTEDEAVLVLPAKVKTVTKVSWKAKTLQHIGWLDMEALMQTSDGINDIYSSSEPQYYSEHPSKVNVIILYPTPNESLDDTEDATHDPYKPIKNEERLTIQCWRHPEDGVEEATLPSYILRRLVKAYVLWKAFAKEGKGQDFKASNYYATKYKYLIDNFKKINAGVYVSKRYALQGNTTRSGKPARPVLPSNFEKVTYR